MEAEIPRPPASWRADEFVLRTRLTKEELGHSFWNGIGPRR